MGCDYFYKGRLEDHRLQEKALELVAEFWSDGMWIYPEPKTLYPTLKAIDAFRSEEGEYPFNFFGFVPFPDSDFLEYGQMVFDRSDGGRLVTLYKLPPVYEGESADSEKSFCPDVAVRVRPKGYLRGGASYRVGLLFCMIKRRYFHDLWVGDDYDVFKETEYLVDRLRIADRIMDEKLIFDDCYALFETAHVKYRAKRASRKGAQEGLARIQEARRGRLQGEDHAEPTIVNPIRSLGNIYAETAALLKAESTAEKIRSDDDMQEERW
jgi:hypothetical protein